MPRRATELQLLWDAKSKAIQPELKKTSAGIVNDLKLVRAKGAICNTS